MYSLCSALTFADLQLHYIHSPTTVLHAQSLLSGIVSNTIPSRNCTASIDEYIATFLDDIHTYNSLVDPEDKLPIDAQLTHFTNFIHLVCDVNTIREHLHVLSLTNPIAPEDQLRYYRHMAIQVHTTDTNDLVESFAQDSGDMKYLHEVWTNEAGSCRAKWVTMIRKQSLRLCAQRIIMAPINLRTAHASI